MMSDNKPFITVAIATYNYAHFLPRCIEALSQQTFRDFDVIIVDDGSTDDTQNVAQRLINQYASMTIQYVFQENAGAAAARNTALQRSESEYLCIHDGDDWMEPEGLTALAEEAKKTGADRIYSEIQLRNEQGKVTEVQRTPPNPCKWTYSSNCASLYKRTVFLEHKLEWKPGILSEDIYMNFWFSLYCKSCAFVPMATYNWVQHNDSISAPKKEENPLMGQRMMQEICDFSFPVYQKIETQLERDLMEYEVVKIYYIAIYRSLRKLHYKNMMRGYKATHDCMMTTFPSFLKNPNLFRFRHSSLRLWPRTVIAVSAAVEKLHLMWLVLFVYHVIGKVYRFKM
ncbi:MAG: glycosyltransferase family A protein [Ruthenibacterium sp.]